MNKVLSGILKTTGIVLLTLIALLLLLILGLTIFEYRPAAIADAEIFSSNNNADSISTKTKTKILTWNIGYGALGKTEDFFMDGGKRVRPKNKKIVKKYTDNICETIQTVNADINFIQEVDQKAHRSYEINQIEQISQTTKKQAAYTHNFNCLFCPIPFPPIGQVKSGVAIFTNYKTTSAQRYTLPSPFKWPVRIANLKRCMLVTRLPVVENNKETGKELVLVNFHLEAFDDGEGKKAQTKVLVDFLNTEYQKGNYIIAGGDFNQRFPNDKGKYPVVWPDGWQPGQLDNSILPEGFSFAIDDSAPTCRSVEFPYTNEYAKAHNWQYYVFDGFIVSPNISCNNVHVLDKDFENADHNPVLMEFILN